MAPLSTSVVGRAALQPGNANAKERVGSLADAMQRLAAEVTELEGATKLHYEKMQPFLEATPTGSGVQEGTGQVVAPLASAIMEYVERIRSIRRGIEDINDRIAY